MIKSLIKRDWFIGLVIMSLFLIAAEAGWFAALDRQAYDLGVQFTSSKEAHEDIVVIAIDDKSLRALGAWPWSRDVLAETTKVVTRGGPKIIGYTLPLDSNQFQASRGAVSELRKVLKQENKLSNRVNRALRLTESSLRGDDKLAASFKAAGRIVLAMSYAEGAGSESGLTPSLPRYMQRFTLPRVAINNLSPGFGWPTPGITRAEEVFPPLESLTRPVGAIGVNGMVRDFGGQPLMVKYGSEVLPSFALMMATRSKGLSAQHIESQGLISPMLDGKELGADYLLRIYPRFYSGQENKSAITTYSLIDVLDGSIDVKRLRDKIIIVGLTSPSVAQMAQTPSGEPISATLVTAHTVSSILNNEQYHLPNWAGWALRVLMVALGLYMIMVFGRARSSATFFFSMFVVLMIFNTHFLLMSIQSMWIPMMPAVAMLIFGQLQFSARHLVNGRVRVVQDELSTANRQLGLALQAQGYLDQAFEKLRHSDIDDSLLGLIYTLGLDYERKRQFNKAEGVFKFILQHDPKYNDVSERIEQNEQAANTVVLGGGEYRRPRCQPDQQSERCAETKTGTLPDRSRNWSWCDGHGLSRSR